MVGRELDNIMSMLPYKRVPLKVGSGLFILHKCKRVALSKFPSGIAMPCRFSHSIMWALLFAAVGHFSSMTV